MLPNIALMNNKSVYGYIQTFIQTYAEDSKNTAISYERNIKQFFRLVCNKDLNELTKEDINIDMATLMQYRNFLKGSGKYKNSTIKQNIESIRSLYKYLKGNRFDVNVEMFSEAAKKLKDDRVNVGFLSFDETLKIAEAAKYEKHKSEEKRTLILLALTTSIRKDAILKIKYENIRPHDKEKDMYVIESDELFDKGSMVKDKEIPSFIYDMLLSLSNEEQPKGFIFSISYNTINSVIKRLAKQIGVIRSVSFHSIKRAGVDYANEIAGLHAAQMQGGHKSPETTARYIHNRVNVVAKAMSDTIDNSIFDELSRDEMLILLKSMENGTGMQLRKKAQEIIDGR
jgi:Site-specific recombinase XerD